MFFAAFGLHGLSRQLISCKSPSKLVAAPPSSLLLSMLSVPPPSVTTVVVRSLLTLTDADKKQLHEWELKSHPLLVWFPPGMRRIGPPRTLHICHFRNNDFRSQLWHSQLLLLSPSHKYSFPCTFLVPQGVIGPG